MNLFLHELKQYWKVLFFWSIGILAMVGGGMGKFTAIYDASDTSLTDMLDQLPKAFLAMFGMSNVELTTLSGFYGVINFYLISWGQFLRLSLVLEFLRKKNEIKLQNS